MSSTKPYLIRAIHEWCVDQGLTPYMSVAVDATTRVPREFVKDGEIVLNVGHDATHQLNMGNDEVTFQARFGGRPYPVVVPVERVLAIYARENGQGMAFEISDAPEGTDSESEDAGVMALEAEDAADTSPDLPPSSPTSTPPQRPFLTRVK